MRLRSGQRESGTHPIRRGAIERLEQWRRMGPLGLIAAVALLGWGMASASAAPFAYIPVTNRAQPIAGGAVAIIDTARCSECGDESLIAFS